LDKGELAALEAEVMITSITTLGVAPESISFSSDGKLGTVVTAVLQSSTLTCKAKEEFPETECCAHADCEADHKCVDWDEGRYCEPVDGEGVAWKCDGAADPCAHDPAYEHEEEEGDGNGDDKDDHDHDKDGDDEDEDEDDKAAALANASASDATAKSGNSMTIVIVVAVVVILLVIAGAAFFHTQAMNSNQNTGGVSFSNPAHAYQDGSAANPRAGPQSTGVTNPMYDNQNAAADAAHGGFYDDLQAGGEETYEDMSNGDGYMDVNEAHEN